MDVTTYTTAQAFLTRAEAGFVADEAANNLIYGLARRLIDAPDFYATTPFFATVDQAETVVVAALRTPPHNLLLYSHATPTDDERVIPALASLAETLAGEKGTLPGVNGRSELAEAFAAQWTARTDATAEIVREMRIFKLTEVNWPPLPSGRVRPATLADADLLATWIRAFEWEALGTNADTAPVPPLNRARQMIEADSLFVWERTTGEIVSLAAASRATVRGRTVSLVYTPPEHRGQGYASATVAALSDRILQDGYDFCTLFTDLANPTSNHIYQVIGYRPVCDFTEYRFVG